MLSLRALSELLLYLLNGTPLGKVFTLQFADSGLVL